MEQQKQQQEQLRPRHKISRFLSDARATLALLPVSPIEKLAVALGKLRRKRGRLFILGLGGSAANASHATNDFRKLCHIDAHCPTDNIAEFTARANDEGWRNAFSVRGSKRDALLVLSVGGGTAEISIPIVQAIDVVRHLGMSVFGIVGRDGGYTAKHADIVVIIPTVNPAAVTFHTESMQLLILHALVLELQKEATKW